MRAHFEFRDFNEGATCTLLPPLCHQADTLYHFPQDHRLEFVLRMMRLTSIVVTCLLSGGVRASAELLSPDSSQAYNWDRYNAMTAYLPYLSYKYYFF